VVREIAGHFSTATEWKPLAPAPFISSERQEITDLLRIASPRTSNAGLAEFVEQIKQAIGEVASRKTPRPFFPASS